MKTQKTPQQKKRLAYQRDYVFSNAINNDKSSRKSWPAKKTRVNQAFRRKINQVFHLAAGQEGDEVEARANNIQREKIRQWGKLSLGEAVPRDKAARIARHGRHKALHAYYDAHGINFSKPRKPR